MTPRKVLCCMWLLLSSTWLGCESPIVGLQCRAGYTLCADTCVDLSSDFRNCGSCGHSCGQYVCDDSTCSSETMRDSGMPGPDAGKPDGGRGAGDAGLDGGDDTDGGLSDEDSGLPGCAVGYQECDGVCANPSSDPAHCGSCSVACKDGEFCSSGECQDDCATPLTQCGPLCLDLQRDPDHCGDCTKRCASGICELGACADAIAGQAVIIGHDFTKANTAMQRLAGNAVFLGLGAPVRVLIYSGDADPTSIEGVERAIDVVKEETGRAWQRVQALESLVPLQLSAADVLLIHAQVEASNSTLQKLGEQWGNAIAQFVSIGGVVVVIDAPSERNGGTYQVLEPARIFRAEGRESIESQPLTVTTPGLGVAVRVPERYMSLENSVRFTGVSTPGTFVVVDKDDLPVIVQRVVSAR